MLRDEGPEQVGVGVGGDAARLRHDYALHLTPRVDLAVLSSNSFQVDEVVPARNAG
jgi:hypothetical protein